jgi:O-methyltransferase
MVHDYNNNYQGCKKAVNEFCRKYAVSFVPIPDIGGTIVIQKPVTV